MRCYFPSARGNSVTLSARSELSPTTSLIQHMFVVHLLSHVRLFAFLYYLDVSYIYISLYNRFLIFT